MMTQRFKTVAPSQSVFVYILTFFHLRLQVPILLKTIVICGIAADYGSSLITDKLVSQTQPKYILLVCYFPELQLFLPCVAIVATFCSARQRLALRSDVIRVRSRKTSARLERDTVIGRFFKLIAGSMQLVFLLTLD